VRNDSRHSAQSTVLQPLHTPSWTRPVSKLCGSRKRGPKRIAEVSGRYLSRLVKAACRLAEFSEEGRVFAAFRQNAGNLSLLLRKQTKTSVLDARSADLTHRSVVPGLGHDTGAMSLSYGLVTPLASTCHRRLKFKSRQSLCNRQNHHNHPSHFVVCNCLFHKGLC
jgi:hypothetical protein